MASSRKPRSAKVRIAVGLSGGVDSVVLLHMLRERGVEAIHVHHGLSPNADAWAAFCRQLCKQWKVPLTVRRVKVAKKGEGLEAAARRARYAVFEKIPAPVIALAHNLDDQAETVLMNLLRGAGVRGARGMLPESAQGKKTLLRPLLGMPRAAILAYAREHGLEWIEDESNADESLTRNFIRRRVGPLLEERFPGWKAALARAARHFSTRQAGAEDLLRQFLQARGLRAPSEAKLAEMVKQLAAAAPGTRIEHDGAELRLYRGEVRIERPRKAHGFEPVAWHGEPRLALPALGGELRFRKAHGAGIDAKWVEEGALRVRLRSGGERLQPDARRPRRTLKNLFQEAGVPAWQRERLPPLYRGAELVWAPGLGIDARFKSPPKSSGFIPEWRLTC